jgi:uncharacterized protein (DUF1800 family)
LAGAAAVAATRVVSTAKAAPVSVSADVDPNALVKRLVDRITFGFTDAEFASANALGYQGYLEQQLNPDSITEDPALVTALAAMPTLTMTLPELYVQRNTNSAVIVNELIDSKIRRAISSKKQLLERMVEFWSDHFNIDINLDEENVLKTVDDRAVIRPNALGTFGALLTASAQSPAMMYYLNNDISTKNGLNENYGRELLELHTLSPASGYTQNDVREVARCFTGWGRYSGSTNNGANAGLFRYNANNHDKNAKTLSPVFDIPNFANPVVIPANQGDMVDGMQVLDILKRHPSTATFIATKLCKRFLGEDVQSSVISHVASVYLSTQGDIKAMLRAMLSANILLDAPVRFKRPFHLAVSAIRTTPTTISATSALRTQLSRMGHMPFNWGPPDGYPDDVDYWSGSELPRWNFGASVTTNGVSGVSMNLNTAGGLFFGLTTRQQIMDKIDQALFGGEMKPSEKTRLLNFLPSTGTISLTQMRDVLGLAFGSPGFQFY